MNWTVSEWAKYTKYHEEQFSKALKKERDDWEELQQLTIGEFQDLTKREFIELSMKY